jgi:hypothetical protein
MATQYLEDLIVKLLTNSLSDGEKRRLATWYDINEHIDEESRDEMKDALLYFVMNNINASRVIRVLTQHLTEEEEEGEGDAAQEDDLGW